MTHDGVGIHPYPLALVYQSNVEISADPSAKIILQQGSRVIQEKFVSRQSQRKNDRALINVAAENNCHKYLYILQTI